MVKGRSEPRSSCISKYDAVPMGPMPPIHMVRVGDHVMLTNGIKKTGWTSKIARQSYGHDVRLTTVYIVETRWSMMQEMYALLRFKL